MSKANQSYAYSDKLQSQVIDFLRFPLIAAVVFIHTDFSPYLVQGNIPVDRFHYPIFTSVFIVCSKIVSEISVPLFFFIAGFLFFYREASFTMEIYLKKLKKRIKSLLLPYIFWNLIAVALLFLAQYLMADNLLSGRSKLVVDYRPSDWLWSFWDTSKINTYQVKSLPANSPLWFIRDLMVAVILSPLIYVIIRRIGIYAVIAIGLFWLINPYYYKPGCSSVCFFFFSLGAYFSIKNKNFIDFVKPALSMVIPLYILIVVTASWLFYTSWYSDLYGIGILVGMVLALSLTAHCIEKGTWRPNAFLVKSSFFIFAYHRLPLVLVIKLLFVVVQPQSEGSLLLLYIGCPALTILFGLFIYRIASKLFPKGTALISGGR